MPQVDPDLFDRGQFQAELALKASPIAAFKKAIRQAREVLDGRFQVGRDIRRLIEDRAWFVDNILQKAWDQFDWSEDADIALVAVGGYGRGELHPYSDIDLLILLDSADHEVFRDSIERFLTLLWDIGLEVGQSVRSVDECATEARADLTVDHQPDGKPHHLRPRAPAPAHAGRHQHRAHVAEQGLLPRQACRTEDPSPQVFRHRIQPGTQRQRLARRPAGYPDDSVGGPSQYGTLNLRALAGEGLPAGERKRPAGLLPGVSVEGALRPAHARRPLRRPPAVRSPASIAAAGLRRTDDAKLAIENFMQQYYRVVMSIAQFSDLIIQHFEEVILFRKTRHRHQPINSRFQLHDGYIEARNDNVFRRTPFAMLEIFVLMAQQPEIKGVRADTIRLLREHRHLIDDDFRNDIRNTSLFIELFKCKIGIHRNLRRMNRYGILGRICRSSASSSGRCSTTCSTSIRSTPTP
jgi:[protein-PII] uridylyltransferase